MSLIGQINEKSAFPKFEGQTLTKLVIDLEKVPNLNSMGILHWIRWWKDLKKRNPDMSFQFEHIHMPVLSCASVVAGFLPDGSEILSAYIPYHNEDEGVDLEDLQKKGVNYDDQTYKLQNTIVRSHNGKNLEFEIDCMPSRDLRCLNLKIENV